MTRKEAVQKLQNILKDWENCKLDAKASSEILTRIRREIGMVPPDRFGHLPPPMEIDHEWDPPKKKRRSMKEISEAISRNNASNK